MAYQMDLSTEEREIVLKMREKEVLVNGRCEDYPCCGHTPLDPCTREWYDAPDAFDTSKPGQEHRLCDHENNDCYVADRYDNEED